ncbi:MAG: hypothetical protein LBL45_02790 [Treponema sp.]|jgi:hypothetical protein|nr:hypothetical protein [Treponema sp.]
MGYEQAPGEKRMGDMTAQGRDPPQGVTFEEVWAMFQENARQQEEAKRLLKEISVETGRLLEKMSVETDRLLEKMSMEADRLLEKMGAEPDWRMQDIDLRMQETDRKIEKFFGRMGDVIEHLMSPKLHEKFKAMNFVFNRISRDVEIWDYNQRGLASVDILFENDEYALAVEVNIHLTTEDVNDHLRLMEMLRRAADERDDRRKYLGAVAGSVVTRSAADYALKNGFYVIIPSEETVDIEAPKDSNLRIW